MVWIIMIILIILTLRLRKQSNSVTNKSNQALWCVSKTTQRYNGDIFELQITHARFQFALFQLLIRISTMCESECVGEATVSLFNHPPEPIPPTSASESHSAFSFQMG